MGKKQTIIEKIWDKHVVHSEPGKPDLIYIDLHLIHEVTSPQAFEGLRINNRTVRRPDLTFATVDHIIPTKNRDIIKYYIARKQMEDLVEKCKSYYIHIADMYLTDQ